MATSQPNVIIVTTDQQRTDSLSCYGSADNTTPNLDRLAAAGVVFDRAYCANPVCTPARASIFSGRYLSRHGAWNVGMNVPEDEPLISHRLAAAGYATHYIGKAHFQAFSGSGEQSRESLSAWPDLYPEWIGPYYGFESVELSLGHVTYGMAGHYGAWVRERVTEAQFKDYQHAERLGEHSFGGEAYDWDLPTALHSSVWTADRTIEFLRRQGEGRPFLLGVGFQDPHHPHGVPRDFTDRVDPARASLPDYLEGELEDKPPHFLEARQGRLEHSDIRGEYWVAGQGPGPGFTAVTDQEARLGRAYYYTMVRLIDREMGRLLDYLDSSGLGENTVVVFTTDHGELLGDHGLWMKGPFLYEQLARIPMIVRWPAGFRGGRRSEALFSQVDIVPTVMAAAGLPSPSECDGVSALDLLRGEADTIRDHALIETVDDPAGLRAKTIVTPDRKLTRYCNKPYGELFDLERDPAERVNHWHDPAYSADKCRLLGKLLDTTEPLEKRAPRYCYA